MKLMLLGDLHLGAKSDNEWIQNIQRDAIRQAIEHSKRLGITRWIQTGDWFDVRKAVTHTTMQFNREIVGMIKAAGIHVDVIIGNHDMHLKNKIHPNACSELLTRFDNITVYDEITTVDYDGIKIDLVPWICEENEEQIMKFIENSTSLFNVGHYELVGFYFYKGLKSHGADPAFLRRYKKVFSGHYHTRSSSRNVDYIGTPYTLTSGDENDPRGFTVLDTETLEDEFIENETMWHRKIEYPCSINPEMYKGLFVRVFVNKMDNNFSKLETALESVVYDMKVVMKVELSADESLIETVSDETKTLIDIIEDYISAIPDISNDDMEQTKKFSKELYMEHTK